MANNSSLLDFRQRIWACCDPGLLAQSRIHRLPSFELPHTTVWLKRDDELGFGISGSKKRKYASLIPALIQSEVPWVGLIGGARSNHVIGLIQLLREKRIPFHLFLKQTHHNTPQGNRLLLALLTEPGEITWIEPTNWATVEEHVRPLLRKLHPAATLIPEGGTCQEALAGALTLSVDVIQNEKDHGIRFDQVFVDSGTGLTAAALACGLARMGHPATVNVILTAGDEAYFTEQLDKVVTWGRVAGFWGELMPNVVCHVPMTARSFGALNQTVLRATQAIAQTEGVLTDPIYATKLLMTAKNLIHEQSLVGNSLIIHTGGGTSIFGFAEKWV